MSRRASLSRVESVRGPDGVSATRGLARRHGEAPPPRGGRRNTVATRRRSWTRRLRLAQLGLRPAPRECWSPTTRPCSGTPPGSCWSAAGTTSWPRPAARRAHWMPSSSLRRTPCFWMSVWATTTVSRSVPGSRMPGRRLLCCSPRPAPTRGAMTSWRPAAPAASSARRGSSTLTSGSSGRVSDTSPPRISRQSGPREAQSSEIVGTRARQGPRLRARARGVAHPALVLAPAFRGRSLSATAPRRWAAYRRTHVECGVRRLASNRRRRGLVAGRLSPLGRSKCCSRRAVDGEVQRGPLSDG